MNKQLCNSIYGMLNTLKLKLIESNELLRFVNNYNKEEFPIRYYLESEVLPMACGKKKGGKKR